MLYTVLPKNWYERHEERGMSWAELGDFLYDRARPSLGADSEGLRAAGRACLEREGMDPAQYSWHMETAMTLLAASGADYPELRGVSGNIRLQADCDGDVWYLDAIRDAHGRYLYSDGGHTRGVEVLSPAMADLFRRVAECIVHPERLYASQAEGPLSDKGERLAWAREHRDEVLGELHATPDEYVALAIGPDDARRWSHAAGSVLSPLATGNADSLAMAAAAMVGSRLRLSEDVAQLIDEAMVMAGEWSQRTDDHGRPEAVPEETAEQDGPEASQAQAPSRGPRR